MITVAESRLAFTVQYFAAHVLDVGDPLERFQIVTTVMNSDFSLLPQIIIVKHTRKHIQVKIDVLFVFHRCFRLFFENIYDATA